MKLRHGIVAATIAAGTTGAVALPAGATGWHDGDGRRGEVAGQGWERHDGGRSGRHGDQRDHGGKGERRWDDRGDRRWDRGHDWGDKGDEVDNGGEQAPEALSTEDAAFLQSAGSIALNEVLQGATVLERSQDPAVLELANDVVRDHWKQLLKQVRIHEAYGIPFPTLTPEQVAAIGALQATPDDQLDATFVANQVAGHESALELFRTAAEGSDSRLVQWFAAKQVPKLERHLAEAQAIQATVTPPAPEPAPAV